MSAPHHLSSPPGFRLPELRDVTEGVGAEIVEPVTLESTYHDTADLRLARGGVILRHRSDDGWVVRFEPREAPSSAPETTPTARGEHRFDGDPASPPDAALELVRALVRSAKVAPVAKLRTRRRRIELHDELGKTLGTITDDEVSVLKGRRVAARFRELEVDVYDNAPDALADAVAGRLRTAGAGPPDPTPKIVRALGWSALEPPDVSSIARLGPSPSAADVVRTALAASVAQLIERDPGVRLGEDPEDVHQARVATRRIRSNLRTFRDLFEPEWTKSLRDRLRSLGQDLGAVRDTEVLSDRLRDRVDHLSSEDRDIAKRMLSRLHERWDVARHALQDTLRTDEYTKLLDDLVDAAREPALLPQADGPASEALPPLLQRPWNHVKKAVEELDADPPD